MNIIKKPYLTVLLLIALAFILRMYPVIVSNIITHDGIMYIENAKMVAKGEFKRIKVDSFFNLYPVLIVVFQKAFNNWETSGRMVSVVFGTLGVIPLFFLTKRLLNLNIAVVTAFFYVISPHIVEYSSDVLREALFWSLFLFAIWFGIEGILSNTKFKFLFLFLSALFTGLSVSVRIEGIIAIFIILVWAACLYKSGDLNMRIFLSYSVLYIFFLIMTFLPVLFFIRKNLGWWELGLLGDKIYYTFIEYENLDNLMKNYSHLLDNAPARIKGFIDISLRQRYAAYLSEVIYKFIKPLNIVFFILALFGLIKRRVFSYQKGEIFYIIWFFIAFISCYIYVAKIQYLGTRHGLLMGLPVLVWSAIGFFELSEKAKGLAMRLKGFLSFFRFSTLIIIFIIIAYNGYGIFSSYRDDKIELKKAGVYLKNMGFKEKNIATIPPLSRVVFYADATPILIPQGISDEELKKLFSENKVDYVIIDKRMYEVFFYKANRIFDSPQLKKIEIPIFNTFREYSLEIYQIT